MTRERLQQHQNPVTSTVDADEGKRLANRLAQRKFRRQRKDYISHLERELALAREGATGELVHRREEIDKLNQEKADLRGLLEHVVATLTHICGARPCPDDSAQAGPRSQSQLVRDDDDPPAVVPVLEPAPDGAVSVCEQHNASIGSGSGSAGVEVTLDPPVDPVNMQVNSAAASAGPAPDHQWPPFEQPLVNAQNSWGHEADMTGSAGVEVTLDPPVDPVNMQVNSAAASAGPAPDHQWPPFEQPLVDAQNSWDHDVDITNTLMPDWPPHHALARAHTPTPLHRRTTVAMAPRSTIRTLCPTSCMQRHGGSEKTRMLTIMLRRQVEDLVDSCTHAFDAQQPDHNQLQSLQIIEHMLVSGIMEAIISSKQFFLRLFGISMCSLAGGGAWVVWQVAKTLWVLPHLADVGIIARAAELGYDSDLFCNTMPSWLQPTHVQKTVEHNPAIDFIPWIQLRESLIMYQDKVALDDVVADVISRELPTGAASDHPMDPSTFSNHLDDIRGQFQTHQDRMLCDSFYASLSMFRLRKTSVSSDPSSCTSGFVDSLMTGEAHLLSA